MRYFLRGLLLLLPMLQLMANPIEATLARVNGALAWGYDVGPYFGRLEQQPLVFNCVDFANDASLGQQWAVNLSPIDDEADLGNTRYGAQANALQLYQEAAWLTEQYALSPVSEYGDIQATIWQLFDPYAPAPTSNYWLNLTLTYYAGEDYSNFFVVTNVGPVNPTGQVQEFLTVLNPDMSIYPAVASDPMNSETILPTPEPELMAALGLGLIVVAAVIRWWHRRRDAPVRTSDKRGGIDSG